MKSYTSLIGLLISILIVTIGAECLHAADYQGPGLVFGAGIGFAPVARFDDDVTTTILNPGPRYRREESHSALVFDLQFGYAIDSRNTIVAEIHSSLYDVDRLNGTTWQFFFGPVWYRYFALGERKFFTAVGIGGYSVYAYESRLLSPGLGLLGGLGVELTSHFQLAAFFSRGRAYGEDHTGFTYHDIDLCSAGIVLSFVARPRRD